MHTVGYVLGFAVLIVGVVGVVVPLLPGAVLLVAGVALIGWADGFVHVGWGTIVAASCLAALIWSVDLVAGALGARVAKASKWAVVGASVGFLVGIFFGLPGILLGPALGAVAFEYARNPDMRAALRAGTGAFLGFLLGSVVKLVLATVVVGLTVVRLMM
jgi:uncharacterized protein YqgC (DUF456 family)